MFFKGRASIPFLGVANPPLRVTQTTLIRTSLSSNFRDSQMKNVLQFRRMKTPRYIRLKRTFKTNSTDCASGRPTHLTWQSAPNHSQHYWAVQLQTLAKKTEQSKPINQNAWCTSSTGSNNCRMIRSSKHCRLCQRFWWWHLS